MSHGRANTGLGNKSPEYIALDGTGQDMPIMPDLGKQKTRNTLMLRA